MTEQKGKAPKLIAYQPVKGKTKTYWNQVGAAWETDSGEGLRLQLNSLPLDGTVVLLPPKERESNQHQGQGAYGEQGS